MESQAIWELTVLKKEYSIEKLKDLKNMDIRYMYKYMTQTSLETARLKFPYRTRMLDKRADMGKQYSFQYCSHCRAGQQEGVIKNS